MGFLLLLIVSMVATPADPLSMLLFTLPACAIYALGILAWRAMERRRAKSSC